MALETGTFISDLNPANPVGSDPLAFADDHLRLIKSTLKNTFPNVTGAVTKTHTQLNNSLDKTGDTMTGALTLSGNASSALHAVPLQQLQALYPVGSIYMNATNSANPSTYLGFGTWVAFGAGRVVVGFDANDPLFNAAEKTGGSKDAVVVSHSHTFSGSTSTDGSHTHTYREPAIIPNGERDNNTQFGETFVDATTSAAGAHSHTFSGTTSTVGSSGTNANLQPFITVYMWKRTA